MDIGVIREARKQACTHRELLIGAISRAERMLPARKREKPRKNRKIASYDEAIFGGMLSLRRDLERIGRMILILESVITGKPRRGRPPKASQG